MPNHGIQRPKWVDVLILLVRVTVFMMVVQLILDGEWRVLAVAAFSVGWFTFDYVKVWVERLAGVRA